METTNHQPTTFIDPLNQPHPNNNTPLSESTNHQNNDLLEPSSSSSKHVISDSSPQVDGLNGWGSSQPHHSGIEFDWEGAYEREQNDKVVKRVKRELEGWRGGNGTPRSNYCPTALPSESYYNTPVTGTIGSDLPKEILRIERDWSGGEACQFETTFPIELERRITPTQFTNLINDLNQHLISAYSIKHAVIDNLIAISTWWISLYFKTSHFEKELQSIENLINQANVDIFNPRGLNILSPREVALQYLEIEYPSNHRPNK